MVMGIDSGYIVVVGVDENCYVNVLENEVWNFVVYVIYFVGDIEYKFGIEIENIWNYNFYGCDFLGMWYFDDIEDFVN